MQTDKHHVDKNRAQPGDVLGVDTNGKQTHLGEDRKDEDQRVREARKEADQDLDEDDDLPMSEDPTILGNEKPRTTK